jgi:hypothetical protein
MSFELNNLCRVGGSGVAGALYMYTSDDSIALTQEAGYFNPAANILQKGDAVLLAKQDGTPYLHITYVKAITLNGGVTMAAGTTVPHA